MSENAAVSQLNEKFPGAVLAEIEFRGDTTVLVKKEEIVAICTFLKKELGFNFLVDLCGIDNLGQAPRYAVVYNLRNLSSKASLRLKVLVEQNAPQVDTVSGVWATANWLERECWDLMGISFANHPDLRRILLPADWQGHPLRKDYPLQGPDREPYQGRLS